ncbi:MAG: OmpA family protein, partial [Bacteroidales bacterium]|nr:OmpA family protein [Bacteroidales bacterium]
YSYLWNNKKTVRDIDHLKAGKYTLIATDQNGCIDTLETEIEQPTELELQLISTIDNPCNGEEKGEIDIFVKGSVKPYTYDWSNGAQTQDITSLPAGEYRVKVTGATGCEKSLSTVIKEPPPLELSIVSTEDIKCSGGNNGIIDLSVKGGVKPYHFSWSNGAETEDLSDLVAGSYTVSVVDIQGCSKEISAHIKQPEPLVASFADVKNINCHGDSTGAISIDVKGGTLPYNFKWSNGAVTEDISNLTVGKYSVVITDAMGCSQNLSASVTQPDPLIADIVSVQDVLCKDQKTGNIDISVKGGVTPYIYTWNNGSKEQDLSNVGAGKYSVRIQDANNCMKTLETSVTEPPLLSVTAEEIKNIIEYGRKDGSIHIKVDGGKPPYTYSWSNGAVTQNINDLVAGNYSVIVYDAYGCRKDLEANIEQPDEIQISIDSISHIHCYGEMTGYVRTSVQGGLKPYRFKWNNGMTVNELVNVPAGDYVLTVTDANDAVKVQEVKLVQPPSFSLSIDSVMHPTCYELNNGIIKTTITGGTTPYAFEWSNGSSTQNLRGLTSGYYKITVTDARGCKLSDSIRLDKPDPLEVTVLNVGHIQCNGDLKGKVYVAVNGGTKPYRYNWNHGAREQNLDNVRAGNYTLKVVDAHQCVKTISTTVNEPPALVANFAEVIDVPCKGENRGSISTSVTGGTPPYSYKWSNGDSTSSIQNLYVGKYNVSITDSNGCVSVLSTEITEPAQLTGRIVNVNDINCFGDKEGSISIDVQGGTLPYRFGWSNGSNEQNLASVSAGNYSVKVTDNQGCEITLNAVIKEPEQLMASISNVQHINCFGDMAGAIDVSVNGGVEPYKYSWSNGANTQDLLNVAAGDYTLKMADAKGCASIITASIEEPLPLLVDNTAVNNNRCSGEKNGSVTISVTGGKEPYSYKWNTGAVTKDIQNMPAGNYELTVTDANGCVKTTKASVTEPPVLYSNIDAVNHITCNGESNGSVHISVSGGLAPYTYQWSNGNTTQDLLNVPAGSYSVIIKEGNGCETKLEATITEPTPFVSDLLAVTHNDCYGDKNGTITISADGGTPPYTFRWSNNATTQNLEKLVAGDYSVLVSDANGCNRTIKTTVNEPPKLVLTVDSARNVKCCGDTSGAIFITVTGGVGPYQYLWSHGKTSEDVTGLAEGQYTVMVTDQNGCIVNTPEEGATIYEKIIAQGKFVSRDILFDVGKSVIKERSFVEISRIASFMKEHPELRFSIEGHTDSQGDDNSNLILSRQRAAAVKESLIKFGIDESRLETQGFGESVPVDTNATPEGRANNRRVEFIPL